MELVSNIARNSREAYVELTFSPNVKLINLVRTFVSDFYATVTKDDDVSSRLEVTTHELLENAVKFSVDGVTTLQVNVTKDDGVEYVTLTTRNRSSSEHIEVVRRIVGELANAQDPFAHYQSLMRASALRDEGSGLGLGRVAAECEMELSCRVEQDDLVIVKAVTRLPEAKA